MRLQLIVLCLVVLSANGENSTHDEAEGMRECGNLHRLDFHTLPNARAEYQNSNCELVCTVGDRRLSNNSLNEGLACPLDFNGVCRNGQCIQSPNSLVAGAERECGNLHNVDFFARGQGTSYLNGGCTLKCVVSGVQVSQDAVNEGFACPAESTNSAKICQSGQCVNVSPTVAPGISRYNISSINLTIVAANLTEVHVFLVASACLTKSTNATPCAQQFTTHDINQYTKYPEWGFMHTFSGPFVDSDYLRLEVAYFNPSRTIRTSIGTVTAHLYPLLEKHFVRTKTVMAGALQLEFNESLSIYHSESQQVTGDIELKVDVALH